MAMNVKYKEIEMIAWRKRNFKKNMMNIKVLEERKVLKVWQGAKYEYEIMLLR